MYIGQAELAESTSYILLDDLSSLFNNDRVEFKIKHFNVDIEVNSIGSTYIVIDGVMLTPTKDYYISDDKKHIIFKEPPTSGSTFHGRIVKTIGLSIPDNVITKEKLSITLKQSRTKHFSVGYDDQKEFNLNFENDNLFIFEDDDVMVFIEGLYQHPTRDYQITNDKLILTNSPTINSEIDVVITKLSKTKKIVEIADDCIKNSDTIANIQSCLTVLNNNLDQTHTVNLYKNGGILWVFNERMEKCQQCSNDGDCIEIANGKCCKWIVPSGVKKATFEIWSGGGSGAGMTCCNCCSMGIPAAGGNWAVKTIGVTEGHVYTICAGGTYPCEQKHGCIGGMGCNSYVIGCNLENFCVLGGCGGIMCNGDAHGPRTNQICANKNICPHFGADFGMAGTTGTGNSDTCHCWVHRQIGGVAPFMGQFGTMTTTVYWCNCSCFIPGWAAGGLTGDSTYCDNNIKCCAGGGMGGPGLVKVTYF